MTVSSDLKLENDLCASGHGHEMGVQGSHYNDAANQTDEFDFICHTSRAKPFAEDYFRNDDEKCRFYTGLPSLEALKKMFDFVSRFVTRHATTLNKFQ